MRLDKFLSQMKFCSRAESKSFLKEHTLTICDVRILKAEYHFDPNKVSVYIDGESIFYEDPIHLMVHKPKGYLSANKDELYPCVTELINAPFNRFEFKIAGRLDLDTEGLLILTTDGNFVHEITHPNHHLEKVYLALLDKNFHHEKELLEGVEILDGRDRSFMARALHLKTAENQVTITIDEGKFHQVKRMFLILGYEVIYLKRLMIGKLELKDLAIGQYRQIRKEELYD